MPTRERQRPGIRQFHYRLTPYREGIQLCIWETSGVTENRLEPFLFKLNQRLPSEAAAFAFLQTYFPEWSV